MIDLATHPGDQFQSAPDGEVGGDAWANSWSLRAATFQSAPDGEVGGDAGVGQPDVVGDGVSISPRR